MAQNNPFSRPLTTQFENEDSSQTFATFEEGTTINYVDVTATVNGQLRLLQRFKFTKRTNGSEQSYRIQHLDFSSTADQTFTAGQITAPFTDDEADSITDITGGFSPQVNMHSFYVTAGDTTSS